MLKEIIIIIIVLILVISLDVITNNYTTYAADSLSDELSDLRQLILRKDENNINKKTEEIDKNWDKYNQRLSYYMEHDELEKVGNGITAIKSHIEVKENNDAIENIDEVVFVLKHIEDKEKFSMKSLF